MTIADILDTLDTGPDDPLARLKGYRAALKTFTEEQSDQFDAGGDITLLVRGRSAFIDALLHRIWRQHLQDRDDAALIAVGGYGRGELHPASDIDVLILLPEQAEELHGPLESLVTLLWDLGLEIGHSVRNIAQCVEEAGADLTVATNLMESRLIAGSRELYRRMRDATGPDHVWPTDAFFSAKSREQEERHLKYDDSGYNLEPNIKENPGGLRDVQTIGWVAKRHFGVDCMSDLVGHNFLTESEYRQLRNSESHLWRVRFALHRLTGRHEDRLLFEHQRALASQLGYTDKNTNLAVEQFMQEYYRHVKAIQRLNEMLLQLFREAILMRNQLGEPRPINRRFQARNDYLELINPGVLVRYPIAMLEMFLILQQNPDLKGVTASTIRAVRAHRHLIDESFRRDIRARSLFIEIFREHNGLTHATRRMHRYGILARYLPNFGRITGLMQFDLFHVYTVDEHILMVVRNMRRFALDRHKDECPRCNMVFARLAKHELLYLAGLFHDIAKGRGGDHSQLGAVEAREFCLDHGLSEYDATLVGWLVEKHLYMSHVAQRKDIDDPDVIREFATEMGTLQRLDYLYLLTVADMRGTNPQRWNSWKSSLLETLHASTERTLRRGLEEAEDENTLIQVRQAHAKDLLMATGYSEEQINLAWMNLSTDYFLQVPPDSVAWQTDIVLKTGEQQQGLQLHLRDNPERGCTELMLFGPDRDNLFAQSTALMDQLGLNILGARIYSNAGESGMHSYFLLEEDGTRLGVRRQQEVTEFIHDRLASPGGTQADVKRHLPRRLKNFQVERSEIRFEQEPRHALTVLHLITSDRPGLLSKVGAAFAELNIRVHNARVATAGAIAQDSFDISDRNNVAIKDPAALKQLEDALRRRLDGDNGD